MLKIDNKKKAPLILFTYNRLKETKKTIENLIKADLFSQTDIYIYSDGPKNLETEELVKNVREYLKGLSGYKNIKIVYSKINKGLAKSIIQGVTEIIKEYDVVIVLEDDLLISKDFLIYMNDALNIYKNRDEIWSISGFGPNINIPSDYKEDIYLTLRGCSWGWGTWRDRWQTVEWEIKDFEKMKKSNKLKKRFNSSGNDMFKMLELQMLNKINSWAIRWCYTQFKQQKYTIYPIISKVKNIGFGEDATHGGIFIEKHLVNLREDKLRLNPAVSLNLKILQNFKKFNNLTLYGKVGYFLKKYNLGYKLIKNIMKKRKKWEFKI